MTTSRRFQHPALRPTSKVREEAGLEPESRVDDAAPTDDPECLDEDPVVPRRSVTFSESRIAVQRLSRGDPGGWQHLMKVVADVNQPLDADGSTLLHLLVMFDQSHAIRALLELGADPTRADRRGITPLALNESQVRRANYAATRDALLAGSVLAEQTALRQAMAETALPAPFDVKDDGTDPSATGSRRRL